MRSGACTVQQTLTAEAAIVIKNAMGLARRRGHAQTTPLHVAATLLASDTSLLRRACLQSQPHSGSHPLQCRALELCFNVALNRLPAAVQAQPSLSNALIAALKRAQAHQRRGCIEQQQQPLLAVKVEMEQLVISILDDPSVSRVMREAGFYSTHVKSNVEETVGASISYPNSTVSSDSRQNVSRFHEEMGLNGIIPASTLTSWHHGQQQQQQCNVGTQNLCSFRNPKLLATSEVLATRNKDVRSVVEALVTQKRRNTVIVGEELLYAESIVRDLMGRVEAGDVPDVLKTVQFITPQFSSVSFRLLSRDDVDQRVGELRRIIKSCFGGHHGVIVYVGDLTWTLEINQQKATREEYPNYHDNYSPVDHVILELGRILQTFHHADHSPRLWLLATATYQTYMRCNMRQPSLETQWGLQPVTVPAGGLSLSLQLSSATIQDEKFEGHKVLSNLQETDKLKTVSSQDMDTLNCCCECSANFELEARIILSHKTSITRSTETEQKCTLPYWLQQYKNENTSRSERTSAQATGSSETVNDLRKKWNQKCRNIHPHESQSRRGQTEMELQLDHSSSSSRVSCDWSKVDGSYPIMQNFQLQQYPLNSHQLGNKSNFITSAPWRCSTLQNQIIWTTSQSPNWSVIGSPLHSTMQPPISIEHENSSTRKSLLFSPHFNENASIHRQDNSKYQDSGLDVETTLALGRSTNNNQESNTLSNRVTENEDHCSHMLERCHRSSVQGCTTSLICSSIDANSTDSMSLSVGSESFCRFNTQIFNGSLRKFDLESLKILCKGLEDKVKWQSKIIQPIATTVLQCRSGITRRQGGILKGDAWLLFLGPDRMGKRKIGKALAEIIFGSENNFTCIGMNTFYSTKQSQIKAQDLGEHNCLVFRGKTYLQRLAEVISLDPHSVVLLEEIDQADSAVKNALVDAMERGKLVDSNGREVSLSDAIIIMTSKLGSKCRTSEASSMESDEEDRLFNAVCKEINVKLQVVEQCKDTQNTTSRSYSKISIVECSNGRNYLNYKVDQQPQPGGCPCKRKADWDMEDSIGTYASEKRTNKVSASLDLNYSARENEAFDKCSSSHALVQNYDSDLATDRVIHCVQEYFSNEFFKFIDRTVVFQPFDFKHLTESLLDHLNGAFSRATGEKGCLQIDSTVMDHFVTTSWHTSFGNQVFEKWVNEVFEDTLAKMVSLDNIRADTVIRLIADENVSHGSFLPNSMLPTKLDICSS